MIWFGVSIVGWLGAVLATRVYWSPFLVVLVLASAFRYYVGSDFDDYVFLYNDAVAGKEIPVEISYSLLARGLSYLGLNFQAQILFYTFFTFFFLYKGLTKISQDGKFLGTAIFFVYVVFYFPSLSIMRQALAAAIAFYACYSFLHRGHIIKYIVFVGLSSFFHLSGIVYLALVPMYYFRPSKLLYPVILIVLLSLSLTVFTELLILISNATGFSYKGYSFQSMPIKSPVFYIFTIVLVAVFLYAVFISGRRDYFILNVVLLILVARILAIDYKPLNRIGASFSIFLPVFLYQIFFYRFEKASRIVALFAILALVIVSDTFRARKDYSYYQYSFNICIYDEPCPISIVGDLPLEMLLIREELR